MESASHDHTVLCGHRMDADSFSDDNSCGKPQHKMNGTEMALVDAENTGDSNSAVIITKCCYRYQWVLRCFLLFLYVLDFGLNICTIVKFFINIRLVLGFVSIGICWGSGLVNIVISAWIAANGKTYTNQDDTSRHVTASSRYEQFVLYIRSGELLQWFKFFMLQLALPQRHLQSLAFTCKAYRLQEKKEDLTKEKKYKIRTKKGRSTGKNKGRKTNTLSKRNIAVQYKKSMLREYRNIASLDLVNCCFKAAPQFILQMSVQLNEKDPITFFDSARWPSIGMALPPKKMRLLSTQLKKFTVLLRIVGWGWNIIMLGWSMRRIHTTSRSADTARTQLPCVPSIWVFIWHAGTMGARLILISVGASMWPVITPVVCFLLWAAWLVWLLYMEDAGHAFWLEKTTVFQKVFCSLVVAVVYLLTFVKLRKGSTFCRQLAYITLNFILNGIGLYIIRSYTSISESYTLKVVYIVIGILYVIGNMALLVYYTCSHPTRGFAMCLNHLHKLFKNVHSGRPVVDTAAADESVSRQGTDNETDNNNNNNNNTLLDAVPTFDELPLKSHVVLNKLLDLIGPLPMQDYCPLKEVAIPDQNHIEPEISSSNNKSQQTVFHRI